MLISILIALWLLPLYHVILPRFDKKAKENISRAEDAKEAIEMRKKLLAKRQAVFISYVAIYSVIVTILGLVIINISYVLILVVILLIANNTPKTDISGNLSFYSHKRFLEENEKFYLFLRGFNDDTPFGSKDAQEKEKFNESVFAETIDYALGIPICALGMTKEIDSPIGAKRIYVDDNTWQEKVLELMNKAERIFILVNDRSSCIWEIEQSISLLDKTVFIADNRERYQEVKARMGQRLALPEVSPDIELPLFFRSSEDAKHFENTYSGYLDIVGIDENALEEKKVAERKEIMLQNAVKGVHQAIILALSIIVVLIIEGWRLALLFGKASFAYFD